MAHKRTATLLYTTEENLTVPEFFAVGRPPTAVLLCAVKGGFSMPQTKNICDFQGSSEPIFLAQFFIGHLTLSSISILLEVNSKSRAFDFFFINAGMTQTVEDPRLATGF